MPEEQKQESDVDEENVTVKILPTITTDSDEESCNTEKIHSLDYSAVEAKVDHYKYMFKEILIQCTMKKNGLDMYYEKLTHWNNAIQTSVIFLSTLSTFIQSLSESGETNENMEEYIPYTTLFITSYSGFILSISKYFKFDETKENVHNLRDRFSELHSRIKYYRDIVKPWENESYYKEYNEKEKIKEWVSLIKRVDSEYANIIDTKKELFSSYEKIVDTTVARKYDIEFLDREVKYLDRRGLSLNKIDEIEDKYNLDTDESGRGIRSERRRGPAHNTNDKSKKKKGLFSCFSSKEEPTSEDEFDSEDEMY